MKQFSLNLFDESFINYHGRVLKKDNKVFFYNTGSAFELTFFGTTLSAKFSEGFGQKIRIYLDGVDTGIKYVSDTVVLCDNLTLKEHTIKVVKVNYEVRGSIALNELYGAEYYLNSPAKPQLKFEFIGDSITVGYGVYADGSEDTISNEDGTITYAYKTMLHYNAQANFICCSGISVALPIWVDFTLPSRFKYYSLTAQDGDWDFSKYVSDYVFINLGTNDAAALINNKGKQEELANCYLRFIKKIREYYKDAKIVCSYGMMGVNKDVALGITNAVKEMHDDKGYFFEFKPVDCSGYNGHPSVDGQNDGANQLINFIRGIM